MNAQSPILQIYCAALSTHPPANPVQGLPRLQAIITHAKWRGNPVTGWENQGLASTCWTMQPSALLCRSQWLAGPPGKREAMGLSAAKCESREECLGGGWWFTWPASRHYNQQRPWARLACPRVTQAAGLFCRPLQRSQSVSLRSTTLHLLFLSEGATGKLLQQLFSLMAKSTHALFFALISPLLRTGSAGSCSPSLRHFALAGKRVPQLGCHAGQALALPGPPRRGERRVIAVQACSRGKLWWGEVAAKPGSSQNRRMSLSSSDYLKKRR